MPANQHSTAEPGTSRAASLLQARGFRDVQNVPGSYAAWTAAEFPVVKPAKTNTKS
jgi:hypothetical protein